MSNIDLIKTDRVNSLDVKLNNINVSITNNHTSLTNDLNTLNTQLNTLIDTNYNTLDTKIDTNTEDLRTLINTLNTSIQTLNNTLSKADYVVETSVNGTQWYRKYKSGWLEQGGRITTTGASGTITYPKAFKDTNYSIATIEGDGKTAETSGSDTGGYDLNMGLTNFTTTSSRYTCASNRYISWYACGQGA